MNIHIVTRGGVAGETAATSSPIVHYSLPETSFLRTGHPFFIPQFAEPCLAFPHVVLRLSRLGHCVSREFAPRYYNAVTLGVHFVAQRLWLQAQRDGLPWTTATGFDGCATVGKMCPLPQGEEVKHLGVRPSLWTDVGHTLLIDGRVVHEGHTAAWSHAVDDMVSALSAWHTLREGDLIFCGTRAEGIPVQVDSHVDGYIEKTHVLSFNIK